MKILDNTLLLLAFQMVPYSLCNSHFWTQKIIFVRAVSLEGFCNVLFEKSKSIVLVLGMANICPKHSLDTLRHTLNQVLAYRSWNLCPFLLHPLPKFQYSLGVPFVLPQPSLGMVPQVLNGIKVRWFHAMPNYLFLGPRTNPWLSQTCAQGHYLARIYKTTHY